MPDNVVSNVLRLTSYNYIVFSAHSNQHAQVLKAIPHETIGQAYLSEH